MIKSMTGFGRAEVSEGEKKYTVEIKSVNHRYLDVNVRMPKALSSFEQKVRLYLKNKLNRGKVDVYVTYEDSSEGKTKLKLDRALALEYVKYAKEISKEYLIDNDFTVSRLMNCQGVIKEEEEKEDESLILEGLNKTLELAVDNFISSREKEGLELYKDLSKKLHDMEEDILFIEDRSPIIVKEYQENLYKKIDDVLKDAEIDENRVLQEVVIYSDKICTDEETVRLKSHMLNMKENLDSTANGIGRKLDFIAQEMNREANTILSKANDIETAQRAIVLKTEVEKVREQIQNIE